MRSVPMRKELNIYAACVFITVTGQLVHPAAARQQRSLTRKDFWTILGHMENIEGCSAFCNGCIALALKNLCGVNPISKQSTEELWK